jgi:hypothetical protein
MVGNLLFFAPNQRFRRAAALSKSDRGRAADVAASFQIFGENASCAS